MSEPPSNVNTETGEILAMASYPWFDPNAFGDARQSTYRNRAVTDMFEPGSIYKMVTLAAALEEITLHPNDAVPVSFRMMLLGGTMLMLAGFFWMKKTIEIEI